MDEEKPKRLLSVETPLGPRREIWLSLTSQAQMVNERAVKAQKLATIRSGLGEMALGYDLSEDHLLPEVLLVLCSACLM